MGLVCEKRSSRGDTEDGATVGAGVGVSACGFGDTHGATTLSAIHNAISRLRVLSGRRWGCRRRMVIGGDGRIRGMYGLKLRGGFCVGFVNHVGDEEEVNNPSD